MSPPDLWLNSFENAIEHFVGLLGRLLHVHATLRISYTTTQSESAR